MNTIQFLQDLIIKGWKFWSEGNRLRYYAPKGESISDVLTQLKQHKLEIIQLLQEDADIFNVHLLSHGQKALWFLWQLETLSAAYNQVFTCRICNDVDVKKLRSVFEELLERHPCLRSTFPKIGKEPIQQIHQEQEVDFQQVDASAWSETERISSVTRESQRPFDLKNESVMRVRLFTSSQKEHILLLTIHHIAADAWSFDIILSELPKLYQAQQDGVLASLPTLKYSYSDYVHSQKKMLQSSKGEKLLCYWRDKLKGELPALNLATDKRRPAIQTYNGASYYFELSFQLKEQLKQLGKFSNATLYMTLLAAFEVLLYRYTGQEDILVGSPIAGRLQSQFREIVGYFVNLVPLRGDLSNNPSFKEFLSQVRQTVHEALTHQDYPFALLVEKLQPHRDPSRSPIFQASFTLQQLQKSQDIQKLFVNEIEKDVDWGGLKLRPFEIPQQQGQFDLDLEIMETSLSVKGILKYNTDLFYESTIERMAANFQNLLSAIVENPSKKVSELSLLSEVEHHQLLTKWNYTECEYPKDKCIHQLFEEQVKKTPLSVAVVFENQQLNYQQLNQRANQLAYHLQSLGVGPEVLAGICVGRSLEMVVGLLGILKAGGAYVPIDPNYPQERLSYMLGDSGVEVLLTQKSLLKSLPEHQARVVCLDTDWGEIEQQGQDNFDVGVCSDNLAYVIYTSGSTGLPKGVLVTHQNLVNHSNAIASKYNLSSSDKVLQFAALSFDVALEEIFPSWLSGATVVLRSQEMFADFAMLVKFINAERLTVLNLPAAFWHEWVLDLSQSQEYLPSCLRLVVVGSEQVQWSRVNMWQKHVGSHIKLYNAYGLTEVTITATVYQTDLRNQEEKTGGLPIGRPIANTQVYILDSNLQPVPVGVLGELYIGGDGLARGYLNHPQLTSEKFIQNPFFNSKSERLYKTGDLARYSRDGNIEFIGRIDNQVKISGFRIELGEIEAVLNSHPQIQQAVVIAKEDISGKKGLVAYVVFDESLTTKEICEFLRQKLPKYMIPSAFVTLDTLPLTPNGKVNRKSLPATDDVFRENEYVAPRTQSEKIIVSIFAKVLGVQNIGIHDNFFELGGHSLLATQVISYCRQAFQIDFPLRYLLEKPTVAGVANVIDTILQTGTYNKITQDLNVEAVLDPTIQPQAPVQHVLEPNNIFLTGATGFLGAYLLYEILEQTPADIYCLVRSTDAESGKQKLKNKLESYFLWNEKFSSRIIPIIGDLSAKFLGLSAQQFNHLANQIDVIYHNGAWVNHIYNYLTLKSANVLGTQEVLRLASEIKVKPVHFISTIGVLFSEAYSETELIRESDIPDHNQILDNGYVQSKWVAEKLVMEARDRGLPVSIYRPAMITGHSQTGVSNTNDFFCRAIKGCIQLGMVPILDNIIQNFIPVDFVSQAIYEISRQKEYLGKTFHLLNPNSTPMNNLFQWIGSLGYSLEEVSLDKWVTELIVNPDNAFYPYAFNFESQVEEEKLLCKNYLKIDDKNTLNSLASTDIAIPPIDKKLLETYFSYFISSGFLAIAE